MSELSNAVNMSQFQYLSPDIDATLTGPFVVMTSNAIASNFCVTQVLMFLTDISGLISIPQNVSIGYTAPNYTDFISNETKDLENIGEFAVLNQQSIILSPPNNTGIFSLIGLPANATSY